MQASSFVQSIIEEGYIIPLGTAPPPFFAKNNQSSMRNKQFVEEAISKLLRYGSIEELSQRPFCCNPLTVAESSKLRLVLDLRHVNQYVTPNKFKYKNLKTFAELFEQGDYFITFDLKNGYHHIQIHREHRKYLGFEWTFANGETRHYQFLVLPFGLNSAGYLFTKVLRPLVKKWRGEGIKAILFVDDGIAGKNGHTQTSKAKQIVVYDLRSAGFLINYEKSDLEPSPRGCWLGMDIDTEKMRFAVPRQKIEKLLSAINVIVNSRPMLCSAKQLSSIAGQISAMGIAIGPTTRLMTRSMYETMARATSWHGQREISNGTLRELLFWLDNIDAQNGFAIRPRLLTSKIMFTDASDDQYGGFTLTRLGKLVCCGKFDESESSLSSTARELLAVKHCITSFGERLAHESVQVNVDNFGASKILAIGSNKVHLQDIAVQIFEKSLELNIQIIPKWIPRDQNQEADYYSKMLDTDDWSIDKNTFDYLNARFGPFDVDRFADNCNNKLPIFNSRHYCPGTACVNAFCEDWSSVNNWLCPPVSLIGSVIKFMKLSKARGILIVPLWKSAYFGLFSIQMVYICLDLSRNLLLSNHILLPQAITLSGDIQHLKPLLCL